MTPDSALLIRNALLNTLRVLDLTPPGIDREIVGRFGIEDAIEALDAIITPTGDLSLPKTLPKSRAGAKGWRRKAAKIDRKPGAAGESGREIA